MEPSDSSPVENDLDRLPFRAHHLVQDCNDRGRYYALFEAERPVGGIVTSRSWPF
ncbi:MAG: hypothetical protein IV100_07570 [Myxococcales bacterium]|nr:hypothetical protein [Myxococcales bacterium]